MAQRQVMAAAFGPAASGRPGRDGGDLGRIQVLPEDALGPSGAAAADDLLTGTIRSRQKSWAVSGSGLGKQLRVDGGGHHGLGADQASLDQQRELQVREATTLTHPGALAVHGHAAADHQVHGLQLAQRQSAARRAPSR